MSYLKKNKNKDGLINVVTKGEVNLKRAIFDLLKLKKEKTSNINTGENESALVLLTGTCNIQGEKFSFKNIGKRNNVFSGKPTGVYLPINTNCAVESLSDNLEIAICSAPSKLKSKPVLIQPEDVKEYNLGVLSWKRKAYFIIDERIESENFYIGETFLEPGKWAFPPHRHDYDNYPEEVEMDEIYHYRVNPENGYGIQVFYTDDRSIDNSYTVRDGDTCMFPEGYHPAGASPVDSLYILWFLAGKKRYFLAKTDEQYKWVKNCENLIK